MAGPLKDPRHERFAQAIAVGMFAHLAEAYRYATDNEKASSNTASTVALRWSKRVDVAARVEEIQAEAQAKCRWEREDLVNFLLDICETPAGKIDKDSRLCQSVEDFVTETPNGSTIHRRRLAMPSKMEAAQSLKFMMGWDRPPNDGSNPAGSDDTLTELLIMIRRRSSTRELGAHQVPTSQ
jgi:hypothetical protein